MANQNQVLKNVLRPEVYQQHVEIPNYIRPDYPTAGKTGIPSRSTTGSPITGFYGARSPSSRRITSSGYSPAPSPAQLPTSHLGNITPSARINFQPILQPGKPNVPTPGQDQEVNYSLSDAELFNLQLRNAQLMQGLGYGVDFQDGQMTYSRYQEPAQTYLTPYGQYGMEAQNVIYETDYLMTQQRQYQQPERDYYAPQYQYRDQYRNQYYSGYGQRYYGRKRYSGYRRYNRYNNDYNNNRYRNYNQYRRDNYANRNRY